MLYPADLQQPPLDGLPLSSLVCRCYLPVGSVCLPSNWVSSFMNMLMSLN